MPIEMTIPRTGESITEVQIAEWLKAEGDAVAQDEAVVEIETDKASMELPAPASGTISKILKQKGDVAEVGEVIAYIEEDGQKKAAPAAGKAPAAAPAHAPAEEEQPSTSLERSWESAESEMVAEQAEAERAAEPESQEAKAPAPPKPQQRVQPPPKAKSEAPMPTPTPTPAPPPAREGRKPQAAPPPKPAPSSEDEIVPMTMLRRRIAQRLVEVQQTAALLTTFNEIDMSAVLSMRERFQVNFQEKYGIKLGFMSFFVKAGAFALMRCPEINAEIRDHNIVYHKYYDIGVAVSTERGLVVPVLRDVDRMSFADIEQIIAGLAARARDNQLKVEELQGGTFTMTNGGVFGSLLSTPIVNPPQSAILGLHAIQDRPVAREGQVVIRPMMYVALTYDHRIVDGREAVTFLRHVKELIEDPARMLMEM